jgi:hypothetical protein
MENLGGRPALYDEPKALEDKVFEYFEFIKGESHWEVCSDEDGKPCDKQVWDRLPEPGTITGLCLFLGFESRQSFHDYAKRDGFSYAIKRARLRIENEYEKNGIYARSPAFHIFALKNLGWVDSQSVDHTTKGESINPTPIKFSKGNNE